MAEEPDRKQQFITFGLAFTLAAFAVLAGLVSLRVYRLFWLNHTLSESDKKDKQIQARLAEERHLIMKRFEEKYHEDTASYDALAKQLLIEKQKVRNLEAANSDKNK